jgi:hypothetical protein
MVTPRRIAVLNHKLGGFPSIASTLLPIGRHMEVGQGIITALDATGMTLSSHLECEM